MVFGDDGVGGVGHLESGAIGLWGALDIEEHARLEFFGEECLVEEDEVEAGLLVVLS